MALAAERPGWPYLLWGGVGALFGLGVVGILSIGIFALAVALLMAIVGVVLPAYRSGAAVAIASGLGIPPLLVGVSNLGGPGERCSSNALSSSCRQAGDTSCLSRPVRWQRPSPLSAARSVRHHLVGVLRSTTGSGRASGRGRRGTHSVRCAR